MKSRETPWRKVARAIFATREAHGFHSIVRSVYRGNVWRRGRERRKKNNVLIEGPFAEHWGAEKGETHAEGTHVPWLPLLLAAAAATVMPSGGEEWQAHSEKKSRNDGAGAGEGGGGFGREDNDEERTTPIRRRRAGCWPANLKSENSKAIKDNREFEVKKCEMKS